MTGVEQIAMQFFSAKHELHMPCGRLRPASVPWDSRTPTFFNTLRLGRQHSTKALLENKLSIFLVFLPDGFVCVALRIIGKCFP